MVEPASEQQRAKIRREAGDADPGDDQPLRFVRPDTPGGAEPADGVVEINQADIRLLDGLLAVGVHRFDGVQDAGVLVVPVDEVDVVGAVLGAQFAGQDGGEVADAAFKGI